jgi:glycosyltransferase involved in cell wall biosynthesis
MATRRLLLEIGPLKEGEYTGVAQVTAALAERMLGDSGRATGFFFGRAMVGPRIVEDLVRRRGGDLITWYLRRAAAPPAPDELDRPHAALFPNRKTCRRGFDVECQIVHDLSTLLTPQFHTADTVAYHATSLLDDVRSNDLTFCVSEATRQDVLRYLGPLPPDRVVAVPLAAAIPDADRGRFEGRAIEPYILVLGTIEPRKNIDVVLRYLQRHRDVLRRTRFVFLGRFGWGESIDSLLRRFDLGAEGASGRLLFCGFVAESAKNALIENARLLIYPSLFEGFGLPVLEAMTLGVPCLTTRSSSIPEVGGALCHYFDPHAPDDFDRVLARALLDRGDDDAAAAARRAHAARYSWAATYRRITDAIDALPVAA